LPRTRLCARGRKEKDRETRREREEEKWKEINRMRKKEREREREGSSQYSQSREKGENARDGRNARRAGGITDNEEKANSMLTECDYAAKGRWEAYKKHLTLTSLRMSPFLSLSLLSCKLDYKSRCRKRYYYCRLN